MSNGAGSKDGALAPKPEMATEAGVMRRAIAVANDYVSLTKPRIISLLLLTTVATMFVADPSGPGIGTILWTMLGGYLAAGGAGAINHYLERDTDSRMERTRSRPLASGRISPRKGLAFGIALGVIATVQLALTVNPLAAALSLAGLLGYVFVYTLWLKPRTPENIVLGGAAGAIPPLVGWAAATGGLTWDAFWPFAVVFFWTPPHFWALSLLISDDYAKTGTPMLPNVRGERATRQRILLYTLILTAVSLAPVVTGLFGSLYLICASVLGGIFIAGSIALIRRPSRDRARNLYLWSLAYLALLFCTMTLDRVL